jgi:hypothetical protein
MINRRELLKLAGVAVLPRRIFLQLLQESPPTGRQFYFDSAGGSDGSAGTTPDSPWRSLAHLDTLELQPGDAVYFKRGSVWAGGLRVGDSGQSGRPILFSAYGTGEPPTFINPAGHAITINGSWTILEHVRARDAHEAGIYLPVGADNNVIRRNEATLVGLGVFVRGQHNVITDNHIHDLKMVVNTSGGDDDYGAVGVWVAGSNNEVAYNNLVGCRAPSQDYGTDGGAIELYGIVNGTSIHHNFAIHCEGFLEVGGGQALTTLVTYNLIVDSIRALHFNLGDVRYASQVEAFRFENNTVVQRSGGYRPIDFIRGSLAGNQLVLRNNIFSGFRILAPTTGFIHEHNLYSHLDPGALALGTGELVADPEFADVAAGDFRLTAGSPAIDRALPLGHGADFDREPVPVGGAPDMGAYEYH